MTEEAQVIQADRAAAKALLGQLELRFHSDGTFRDWDNTVQAFARHRIAAEREVTERAAKLAESYSEVNMEICQDHILMDPLLRGGEWSDENVRLSRESTIHSTIHSAQYHAGQHIAAALRRNEHMEG